MVFWWIDLDVGRKKDFEYFTNDIFWFTVVAEWHLFSWLPMLNSFESSSSPGLRKEREWEWEQRSSSPEPH